MLWNSGLSARSSISRQAECSFLRLALLSSALIFPCVSTNSVRKFLVVAVEDRLLIGPVRVLPQPLAIAVPDGGPCPSWPMGLTIQMRVRRPFMGPVRSEIMAEVLPTPEGPRTMKLH